MTKNNSFTEDGGKQGREAVEWRTLGLVIFCTAAWLGIGMNWQVLGWYAALPLMGALAAFHTSLQHECIHGHPTSWPWLNELLVSIPLAVVFPFRRYRDLHLKHHNDLNLTDPYEDPESYFWPVESFNKMRGAVRLIFRINNTFAGRLLIGPWLTIIGFGRTELQRIILNEKGVRKAWTFHGLGLLLVGTVISALFAMPFWVYFIGVVYPALSLTAMRSYAEHQAAENVGARSAIVETNKALALLYLNNNLHIVHHAHPSLPWYELPALYEQRKPQYLAANENALFNGYSEIAFKFAFRVKQPVDHPFLHRSTPVAE